MFLKVTKFRPIQDEGEQPYNTLMNEYPTFDKAVIHGRRDACLSGVISVKILDESGYIVASYNKLNNYWHNIQDKDGNFIDYDEFFAMCQSDVEQYAIAQGFNISIRREGEQMHVLAGETTIPLDPEMFPWITLAVDEIKIRTFDREEDDLEPYTSEELLGMFSRFLIHRVSNALKRYPECSTTVRAEKIFQV